MFHYLFTFILVALTTLSAFAGFEKKVIGIQRSAPKARVNQSVTFNYKNTDKTPNIFYFPSKVSDCGYCKVENYTQEPILPGKTGSVTIHCNINHEGYFYKTIDVMVTRTSGNETVKLAVKEEYPKKESDKAKVKVTSGKKAGVCGDCYLKEVLRNGEFSRWNGYDAFTPNGGFVAHVLTSDKCKENSKIVDKCGMTEPVVAKDDPVQNDPAVDNGASICVWGAGQKVIYNVKQNSCGNICVGQVACQKSDKTEMHDVVCAVDATTGMCPDAKACLENKDFSYTAPVAPDAVTTCVDDNCGANVN